MSLILSYIGRKGCVIAGDKRRIAYFGNKSSREKLEEELYDGTIKNDEELQKRASDMGITLKISDDACKVRGSGEVVIGEVSFRSPFETKRRRIYGTTNGYQIVEISGSNISKMEKGESSIVVFGNKKTKKMANSIIKEKWENKTSLKGISELFEEVMVEVSLLTPSVSSGHDVFIKHPKLDKKAAQKLLRETIIRDVKLLQKWREKLQNDLLEKAESIKLASKILTEGEIGRVIMVDDNHVEVILGKGVQAFDLNWKPLAKSGDRILMYADEPTDVVVGDQAIIENENLCLKRNNSPLRCDVILCKID
jgi:hypothetical protein